MDELDFAMACEKQGIDSLPFDPEIVIEMHDSPPPPYCYEYPRPMVTVDMVAFGVINKQWNVLLIHRGKEPFAGKLALPGGFLNDNETAETAAIRELREETGLELPPWKYVRFLKVCDRPDRDPRGRVITLAYVAHVIEPGPVGGGDDAADAAWYPLETLHVSDSDMAFDHHETLVAGFEWLAMLLTWRRDLPPLKLSKQYAVIM